MKARNLIILASVLSVILMLPLTGCDISGPVAANHMNPSWVYADTPTTDDLNALSRLTSSEIWACGDHGTIIFYNGDTWQLQNTTAVEDLNSISMFDATSGWAVGDNSTVLYFDGNIWNSIELPEKINLNSVCLATDANEGWIVGEKGIIIHILNGTLVQETSPVETDLTAVGAVSTTDVWAVGDEGVILHRLEGVWVPDTSPTSLPFNCIHTTPEGSVWCGGNWGVVLTMIPELGFDLLSAPLCPTVTAIWGLSSSECWVGDENGNTYLYDNSAWKQYVSPKWDPINAFAMNSETNGWAVTDFGHILRLDDGTE